MSEIYMKAGRGGAGNFYSKQDIIDAAKAANLNDPEAQPLPTDATSTNDLTRTQTSSAPAPEYSHSGRGGAGNWFQPRELQAQGLAQAASPDATSTASVVDRTPGASSNKAIFGAPQRVVGSSKPTYRGGRGGAGNYMDVEAEARLEVERKEQAERVRLEVERRVEKDVEAGLARPPRAYGGAGGAWEMVDMK